MIAIEVTQSHIDAAAGHEGEYNRCPVAICLYEMGFDDVNVDEDVIKLSINKQLLGFKTPRAIDLFIDDFDKSRPVKPFVTRLTEIVNPFPEKNNG